MTGWLDAVLPCAVVGAVGIMILPLPAVVLDVLLVGNIAFAVLLLITSVYLVEPEKFTTLPTALLLSTLFRLAVNIATTRQLLAFGEAPRVVAAFGEVVVGGSIVVGVTIFLIVTVVQFVVIAKGAERIAEVAARFTLDALPGKQMAIDADVRSGVLSLAEAARTRQDLQREAKLFGALDGAMKFVKGDAIAGVVITLINICAGVLVGVTSHGLSLEEAGRRYLLFTVGDGLGAQIPALLVAVSAAISVSRVADEGRRYLGRDLVEQLTREPQGLLASSAVFGVLAVVPGFPAAPFAVAALVAGAFSRRVAGNRVRSVHAELSEGFRPRILSPIVLRLGASAIEAVRREGSYDREIARARCLMFEKWGVVCPEPQIEVAMASDMLEVSLRGSSVARQSLNVQGGGSVTAQASELVTRVWTEHLPELVDDTQTRMLLDLFEGVAEDIINTLIPNRMSITELTCILRALLSEGVAIRELQNILQALAEHTVRPPDAILPGDASRLAVVRTSIRRSILESLPPSDAPRRVFLLEPELDRLASGAAGAALQLDLDIAERIRDGVRSLLSEGEAPPIVLATSRFARGIVAAALRTDRSIVVVVSMDELMDADVVCLAEVPKPNSEDDEWEHLRMVRSRS